jgi:hypothetical protein
VWTRPDCGHYGDLASIGEPARCPSPPHNILEIRGLSYPVM